MSYQPSILFINRVYPPARGATGRILRDVARSFSKDGWKVTIVTSDPQARRGGIVDAQDGPIMVKRVPGYNPHKSAWGYIKVWGRLLRCAAKQDKHDIVVSLTDPPMTVVMGGLIAKWKKSAHVHWLQDMYPDLFPVLGYKIPAPFMKLMRKWSRRALRRCDKIVVIGRCMAARLVQSGIKAGSITVIPNWPDMELLASDRPKTDYRNKKKREKKKIARDFDDLIKDENPKFRVLYSGNLGRAHPFKTVLDAAAMLQDEYDDVEFLFVGDGSRFDNMVAERNRRQLSNVRFLPHQPASRLRDLMESGDIHLVTMEDGADGMIVPSKIYSALAVARPCIFMGPKTCEAARVIKDFGAGDVIRKKDAKALVASVRKFRKDGKAWHAAHNGADEAGKVFVPDEAIRAFKKRIYDILGLPFDDEKTKKAPRKTAASKDADQTKTDSDAKARAAS